MSHDDDPLQWLDEASSAEIASALLAVDPNKAGAVALHIGRQLGPEFGARIDRAVDRIESDPAGSIAKIGTGILKSLGS